MENEFVNKMILMQDNQRDKSFMDNGFSFFNFGPSRRKLREAYLSGKSIGFELGVKHSSHIGQIRVLRSEIKNPQEEEFYNKFLALCNEYNLGINYDSRFMGMHFIKLNEPPYPEEHFTEAHRKTDGR